MNRHLLMLAALAIGTADARAQSANPPPVVPPPIVLSNGNQIVPYRPPYIEGYGSQPTPPPFGEPATPGVEIITVPPNGVVPPMPVVPIVPATAALTTDDGKARLTLKVPAEAEVWLQGKKMDVAGTEHRFTSPVLAEGQGYTYEIRAAWTENGKPVEFARKVSVRSGDDKAVAFLAAPGVKLDRPAAPAK